MSSRCIDLSSCSLPWLISSRASYLRVELRRLDRRVALGIEVEPQARPSTESLRWPTSSPSYQDVLLR